MSTSSEWQDIYVPMLFMWLGTDTHKSHSFINHTMELERSFISLEMLKMHVAISVLAYLQLIFIQGGSMWIIQMTVKQKKYNVTVTLSIQKIELTQCKRQN